MIDYQNSILLLLCNLKKFIEVLLYNNCILYESFFFGLSIIKINFVDIIMI